MAAEGSRQRFRMDNYVEVADRVRAWYETHPEGRIETDIVSFTAEMVVTKSRVFRTADPAERPAGEGHSMLAIPGSTPYTRGSELENCETSSVGRALVMAGVPAKRIASDHEIRVKENEFDRPRPAPHGTSHAPQPPVPEKTPDPPHVRDLAKWMKDSLGVVAHEDAKVIIWGGTKGKVGDGMSLRTDPESVILCRQIQAAYQPAIDSGTAPAEIVRSAHVAYKAGVPF